MAGAPVSPAEYVRAGIEAHTSELYVARPGKVTAYDPLTNTAVVQPMVKHAMFTSGGERVYEQLPEIPFVSVIFPRTGAFAMTMPVEVGTPVLLVFCDVSLAEWLESGELSEPADARRHSLGWPVAIPGFFPVASPLSPEPLDLAARIAGMMIGQHAGDSRIEITPTEIKLGKLAISPLALGPPVVAFMAAVAAWIAYASPRIAAIPAPLAPAEVTAIGGLAGTVASTASTAATGTNTTLSKGI